MDDAGRFPGPASAESPLSGAFNFRDLGGLPTGPGGSVRPGVLFRSDTLQELTDADVERLTRVFGVELVVDLRIGPEAVAEGRGPLAGRPVCYLNAPLRDLPVSDLPAREQSLHFYLEHLSSPSPTLPMVVQIVAAVAGRPAVLHCAAGKDRTGLVTALLLRLLGVDDDAIVADYVASEQNMPRIVERFAGWDRYRDHLAAVPPEVYQANASTMRGFLNRLDSDHGGAVGWARSHAIPDAAIDRLRAALLVDGPG